MSKKVIELVRVSTEGQASEDRAGIPAQRAVNRRTAAQHGLEIVQTIDITDVSGTAVLRSPGMQELLRLIESPDIHGVVAKEFSRLMRPENFSDYALLQHFIDTQTILYLPDGPLDFASEAGKLLGGIRALIAGQERREMLRRLQDAKEAMRRVGKHPGGSATLPYGVGYSKECGWHYTIEAEKVKRAFGLFLSGQTSYTEIGRQLNLPRTNVRFILQNQIYIGFKVYDGKRDPSILGYRPRPDGRQGDRRKIKRAPEEVIKVRVLDGLVTEDDFARAQQAIDLKRLRHWRVRGENPNHYTYNGFLTCGDCGELIYTHTGSYDFYCCKSRNPRERRKRALRGMMPCQNKYMLRKKLEPRIDHVLANLLCDEDFLRRMVDQYNERVKAPAQNVDLTAFTAKIHALREKRQRVLDAYFEGIITKDERDTRVRDIEAETAVYERLLLQSGDVAKRSPGLDLDKVLALVEPFADWAFLGRDDKRKLLGLLCPGIRVCRYIIKDLQLNLGQQDGGGCEVSHSKTVQ
jgi:DNA invertase Pin-like site-specific DNA recombinase